MDDHYYDDDEDSKLKRHSRQYNHDLSQHLFHKINIGNDGGFDCTYPSHILNEQQVTTKDYQNFIQQLNQIYFLQISNRTKAIIFSLWATISLIAIIIILSIGISNIYVTSSNCTKQQPTTTRQQVSILSLPVPVPTAAATFLERTDTIAITTNSTTSCTDLTLPYILTFLPASVSPLIVLIIVVVIIGIIYFIHFAKRRSKLSSFIEKNRFHFLNVGIELNIINLKSFDFLPKSICIEMVKITNEREDSLIRMFKDDKEMKKNFSKRFSKSSNLSPNGRVTIDYSSLYNDHYQVVNHHSPSYYTSTSPKSTTAYTRLD